MKYRTGVVWNGITFIACGFVKTKWLFQKLNNMDTRCNVLVSLLAFLQKQSMLKKGVTN
jgi:hypothetical protein